MSASRPRILVVAPRLDLGGTEIHLSRVLPLLCAHGLDVSVFAVAPGGRLEPRLTEAGVPVLSGIESGPRILRDLVAVVALRKAIERIKPDILHCFLAEPYLIGSLAGIRTGVIRIMSRRSLANYQDNHPLLGSVERRLHRATHALIGNSIAVAEQLRVECSNLEKVAVIYNGVEIPSPQDRQARDSQRRALGIADDAFVMIIIANLIGYKGHADLLAALAGARANLAEPWCILMVGRDNGLGESLRGQAEQLGIAPNIRWLGERTDVSPLLAAADVGILSSHEEGFSNSLLEKMAAGLPVVATRVGGNMDAVEDGMTGLLVPPHDPPALGAAIVTLRDDVQRRMSFGAAARLRVERLFSLETCVQRYLTLYRGLLGGHRSIENIMATMKAAEL